jgi:hypothetical protein
VSVVVVVVVGRDVTDKLVLEDERNGDVDVDVDGGIDGGGVKKGVPDEIGNECEEDEMGNSVLLVLPLLLVPPLRSNVFEICLAKETAMGKLSDSSSSSSSAELPFP